MAKLTIHKLGEAIVFRCAGRIGLGECHILRHAVFSNPHIAIAVRDMAGVTAIDAAGRSTPTEMQSTSENVSRFEPHEYSRGLTTRAHRVYGMS